MFATRTDSVVLTPLGVGLCCLALAIAAPGWAEQTLLPHNEWNAWRNEISGDRSWQWTNRISQYDRNIGSDGYVEAMHYVEQEVRELALPVTTPFQNRLIAAQKQHRSCRPSVVGLCFAINKPHPMKHLHDQPRTIQPPPPLLRLPPQLVDHHQRRLP